jgi:hypothetical protein
MPKIKDAERASFDMKQSVIKKYAQHSGAGRI